MQHTHISVLTTIIFPFFCDSKTHQDDGILWFKCYISFNPIFSLIALMWRKEKQSVQTEYLKCILIFQKTFFFFKGYSLISGGRETTQSPTCVYMPKQTPSLQLQLGQLRLSSALWTLDPHWSDRKRTKADVNRRRCDISNRQRSHVISQCASLVCLVITASNLGCYWLDCY